MPVRGIRSDTTDGKTVTITTVCACGNTWTTTGSIGVDASVDAQKAATDTCGVTAPTSPTDAATKNVTFPEKPAPDAAVKLGEK